MSNEPALHVTVPASLDQVSWLTRLLRAATSNILRDDEFILFEIGVVEIVNNIIEHAFDTRTGTLDVTCALEGARVRLLISDAGQAMPDGIQSIFDALDDEVDEDAVSGRGLRIIKKCFEHVAFYRQDGLNKVMVTYSGSGAPVMAM
ncbi:ATP-binding protein [Niveispirillum fermenti]|uniref:ATP-binding protein n=1 Tax=Niveispirillum fermenti TaxID=1233113 RepID=UPI003A867271